jgi:hypothetical protein
MAEDEIEVVLSRAPDDPPRNDPAFRKELSTFSKVLHDNGVSFSTRGMAFDSADGGGFVTLGEYVIPLATGVLGFLGTACIAWLRGRYGRKVRIKIGEVEAEARSVEEIDALLKRVVDFRDATKPKNKTN